MLLESNPTAPGGVRFSAPQCLRRPCSTFCYWSADRLCSQSSTHSAMPASAMRSCISSGWSISHVFWKAQVVVLGGASILASALETAFRGRRIVRFLILLPWVAPISLGAIGWKWILDSIYSVISWTLVALHFFKPLSAPMWLDQPHLAMASVLLVHSWRIIPFSTVILLAGRTAIPKDIPEAAAVDGAGLWAGAYTVWTPL